MNLAETVNINELPTDQLEAILKKRKDSEAAMRQKEKVDYEKNRDIVVSHLVAKGEVLFNELMAYKQECHLEMDKQAAKLAAYGKLRSNSKGGFTVTNTDNTMRITRRRDTEPKWDERSQKAVELIKDFLGDTIKKRDLKMYEILIGFIQRNDDGDLEYAKVMDLYKHEDKFDDPRWTEGLRMMKEGYSNHLKGFGYEIKILDKDSKKWKNLILNFSSL